MIIKIQQSLNSSDKEKHVLIYNENKKFMYEANSEEIPPLLKLLGKRPKAYFEAKLVNTKFEVYKEVETQNW